MVRKTIFVLGGMLLGLVLAGCAAAPAASPVSSIPVASPMLPTPTPPPVMTPDGVHMPWVTAMGANAQVVAQRVAAIDDPSVANYLRRMADARTLAEGGKLWPGKLREMELRDLRADGAGWVGYSLWTFERGAVCYRTIIGQDAAGGWVVTAWNATLDPAECEASS